LRSQREWAVFLVFSILTLFLDPRAALAQDHVIPLTALNADLRAAAGVRTANLTDIERVIALPEAQSALSRAHLNQDQVRVAISKLSDEELASLADRARGAERDVQGGLIVGLLALIGLIVVVVVVIAVVKG
jgi:hypothetical protein